MDPFIINKKKNKIKIENKFELKILGLNSHYWDNAKSAPYTGTVTNNNNILIYIITDEPWRLLGRPRETA